MRGLSLVAASGGHSSSRSAGLSPSRPFLLRSTGSRRAGSVVVAYGPSCSAACGIFPDQGSNPCPLHRQADSQPLRHQGSPCLLICPPYLLEWFFPRWDPVVLLLIKPFLGSQLFSGKWSNTSMCQRVLVQWKSKLLVVRQTWFKSHSVQVLTRQISLCPCVSVSLFNRDY